MSETKTTRREFIKKSGFTLLTVGLTERAFFRNLNLAANSALTKAAALSANDRMLVVIQLAGGNDSINTVIPIGGALEAAYRQARSTLAVPAAQILPIGQDAAGNQLGFHPNLPKLQALIQQRKAAVINAVGYPNQNRSHFRSMDIWHTAAPDRIETTGWLGGYLDVAYPSSANPLIAVYIGGTLPLGLKAETTPVPAISSLESYQLQFDTRFASSNPATPQLNGEYNNRVQTYLALNRELAPERTYWDILGRSALDAYNSAVRVQTGIKKYTADPNIVYPANNPLARGLAQVAQIIAAELDTKILYVTLGGFDTHQNQAPAQGGHPLLLQYLNDAVDVFYRDLQRLGKDDKVLIMTWSEFGRKVPQNGNAGTDHGASAAQFVFGTPVKGGIIGEYPSLTDLNPGNTYDTKFSIDFRQIYATILENWLETDSREVLGGRFEKLPFV